MEVEQILQLVEWGRTAEQSEAASAEDNEYDEGCSLYTNKKTN